MNSQPTAPAPAAAGPSGQPRPPAGPPAGQGQGFLDNPLSYVGRRIRSGELGSAPVVLGLIIIWAIFETLNGRFLSAQNLSNLSVDIVATGLMSVGIVFVLLLGEIDLSIGSVSGACAAVLAVTNVSLGMNDFVAIVIAVLAGAIMGLVHGVFFAWVGVPAFIVTLAGLLGWNGFMLYVFGKNGTINLNYDSPIRALTSTYFDQVAVGYGLAALAVIVFGGASLLGMVRRQKAGLPARSPLSILLRTGVLAVLAFAAAAVLNQYKGTPLALVIFIGFVVALDQVLRRTSYGRKLFAVGGSVEAARRAGINVTMMRAASYVISGTMAAIGGVFYASHLASANQSGTGQNILMMAIAAAVIGGTSLFGGRGSTYSALLGVLVIQSIASGMALQGISNAIQFIVTGVVLLAAVVIDSLSRRGQKRSGRA